MKIRPITPADNAAAAAVIRQVMTSYHARRGDTGHAQSGVFFAKSL